MPTSGQIRGLILEELLLKLLELSGYRPAKVRSHDDTLQPGAAGLEVVGRGTVHQIDGVADAKLSHPFSNPQRLLVEAKCYSKSKVSLSVVRNAVGTLKDVSEHFSKGKKAHALRRRYHYQYAIFSATGYSKEAQEYAYAHDIYLIPLDRSRFIRPIILQIQSLHDARLRTTSQPDIQLDLKEFRAALRVALQHDADEAATIKAVDMLATRKGKETLRKILDATGGLGGILVSMLGGVFPLVLVPAPGVVPAELDDRIDVEVVRDRRGGIVRTKAGTELFSFDVPDGLLRLFADADMLNELFEEDHKLSRQRTLLSFFFQGSRPRSLRLVGQEGIIEALLNSGG